MLALPKSVWDDAPPYNPGPHVKAIPSQSAATPVPKDIPEKICPARRLAIQRRATTDIHATGNITRNVKMPVAPPKSPICGVALINIAAANQYATAKMTTRTNCQEVNAEGGAVRFRWSISVKPCSVCAFEFIAKMSCLSIFVANATYVAPATKKGNMRLRRS
jgi:hypothetical protein